MTSIIKKQEEIEKAISSLDNELLIERQKINKLKDQLIDLETILIGNKLKKEKLLDELRRLKDSALPIY